MMFERAKYGQRETSSQIRAQWVQPRTGRSQHIDGECGFHNLHELSRRISAFCCRDARVVSRQRETFGRFSFVAHDSSATFPCTDNLCFGTRAQARNGSATIEEVEQWSKWAVAQADRIDPAMGGRFLKAMQDEDAN
jgi:hypothetical protein